MGGGRKTGEISKWVRQYRKWFLGLIEIKNNGVSGQIGIRPYFKISRYDGRISWWNLCIDGGIGLTVPIIRRGSNNLKVWT